jgi:hypothetical protein
MRVDGDPGFGTFVVVEDGMWEGFRAGEGFVRETGSFTELGVGKALAFTVEDEF